MRTLRQVLYIVARALGDILSLSTGRVGVRIGRRALGRLAGLLFRSIFP